MPSPPAHTHAPRRAPHRGHGLALIFALLGAALLGGCASAPALRASKVNGTKTACVMVYGEGFHSMIALPAATGGGQEEWAFGERVWFCDDKHGLSESAREFRHRLGGAFHALFWPNAGVIECCRATRPYGERYPENALRTWQFDVSEAQLGRLRAWLAASRGSLKPVYADGGESTYYPATRPYHVFHTCHHYVAQALREAGVPIHPGGCFLPQGLWWQLDALADRAGPANGVARITPAATLTAGAP